MNIDYVIVSSDESWYLDFWPIVSKLWKKFLGVTPVMALITNKNYIRVYSDYFEGKLQSDTIWVHKDYIK